MSSTEWQDALLYHAAWGHGDQVFSLVSIDDFDPGDRQNLFVIMERGHLENNLNPAWVSDEVVRVGKPSQSFTASVLTNGFTGTVGYYAARLRDETAKRHAVAALTRGLQRLNSNDAVADEIVMDVQSELAALPQPATTNDDTWTIEDLMFAELSFFSHSMNETERRTVERSMCLRWTTCTPSAGLLTFSGYYNESDSASRIAFRIKSARDGFP